MGAWTADPLQLAWIAAAGAAYALRTRRLARRGRAPERRRALAFGLALVVLALAISSPLERLGEERLFSVHMAQHLLLGDLVPLLAVLGLTGPLLRPVLALPGALRLRALAHPLAALALWAADLWLWHLPALYDAALRHPAVHALEHVCFLAGGMLLWAAVLELLPGPRWFGGGARLAALGAVWVAGGALANLLLWSGRPFYPPYVEAPRTWGLSALADQRVGGGIMLVEMTLVVGAVAVWLGVRWLGSGDGRRAAARRGSVA